MRFFLDFFDFFDFLDFLLLESLASQPYTPLMPSVSLVVPAYNEEAGLAATIDRCQATLRDCTDDYEIVILDDCSRDKTAEIMERIRLTDPAHIRTMRHAVNQGIARTFEDLYAAATKDYVFLIPGDAEYPPEALRDAMPLLAAHDIVVCKRVRKNYTLYRHVISWSYRWFTAILFGVDIYDPGATKVVKRDIFTTVPVTCTSVYVEVERILAAVRMGRTLATVDIMQEPRKGGVARGARLSVVWPTVVDMLSLWWRWRILGKTPETRNQKPGIRHT